MYEKLNRIRELVKKRALKAEEAQRKLRQAKEMLQAAENEQILNDIGSLHLSPEDVGEFIRFMKSRKEDAAVLPTPDEIESMLSENDEREDDEDEEEV